MLLRRTARAQQCGVHQSSVWALVVAALALLASCQTVPTVPTPARDASPPTIRLGSAGLKKDFLLTESSTSGEVRRAKRSEDVVVVATAEDNESGVQSVTLSVTVSRICGTTGTNQTFSVTAPIQPAAAPFPVRRSANYTIEMSALRAGCVQVPSSVSVSIFAQAVNGTGVSSATPGATVASYGPDRLRVATFNLYQPGNHPDAVYERWGRELAARADVVILTEVPDARRAQLVASHAGMANVLFMGGGGDVAVLSRGPLHNAQERVIDPPGRLSSNNSNVFSVVADLAGHPHLIVGNHWGIRDANDVLFGPNQNAPGRLQAAQAVVDFADASNVNVALVGGDMNAFAGSGPQDHDDNPNTPDWIGSTAELDLLKGRFVDPFVLLGAAPPHCSNKRIDFVLLQGAYIPVSYEACFAESTPSDHPFVLVTFEAGDR